MVSDTGGARERLDALLADRPGTALPPGQAIALLRQLGDLDVVTLGRLAYRALTGTEPAEEPVAPATLVPGFPAFAAEVIMRAILGPDHRRPTPQALLIVLDTVPVASWPTSDLPPATAAPEPEAEPAPEPAISSEVAPEAEPAPEPAISSEVAPGVEADSEAGTEAEVETEPAPARPPRAESDARFRAMLTPSREVPRIAPLEQAPAGPTPADLLGAGAPITEPSEPTEPTELSEPDETAGAGDPAEVRRGMHEEFRGLVAPPREVPRIEPLSAEQIASLGTDEVTTTRRRGRRRRRQRRSRLWLWALLAVAAVLVLVVVLGGGGDDGEDEPDSGFVPQGLGRQGASLSIDQLVSAPSAPSAPSARV